MNELISLLISGGLFGLIGVLVKYISRVITSYWIFKHPELSNEKVKYITQMLSKK